MEPKITFRGWAGHFICGDKCRFRLNTLIEYKDIKIVVSTVGVLPDPLAEAGKPPLSISDRGFMTIGHERHFETMAFHAEFDGKFWDANVQRQVNFESQWSWKDLDSEQAANDGHYNVIDEICLRLKAGEKFEHND